MSEQGKKRRKKLTPKGRRGQRKGESRWKLELKEIDEVSSRYDEALDRCELSKFSDLPLSKRTMKGLRGSGYSAPTEIQAAAIPLILKGRDVLGAAKTGSGKTLAFLVPLLELLWRERWTSEDGLGALVISPTRELAYQTFEVLRSIGSHHDFSAGLVIGGKDVSSERTRIQRTNIVVCTPGRLLQHMDETVSFDCSSLKMLVLDEADRILDLGFRQTMNAVVENLPVERQTLLFSATQTKSVRDLARLSLANPEYIAVHEHSQTSTPCKLTQSYVTCELHEKLDILYSFIRSHTSSKLIVFMSACKQVKYVYEAFRRLRPGIPLMALYGRQKQLRRVGIYNDFCKKKSAVLLCTDIAARGLDFPAVHWVIQLDCPEDANTYIHRVGRTARYEKDGNALLILLSSEVEGMLEELEAKKIPIEEIRVNPKKLVSIQPKLEAFCAQDSEMKNWAQRSFICYLRSIYLQSNKKVFDIHKLPTDEFSQSLGMAQPPRIRFLQRLQKKEARELQEQGTALEVSAEDSEAESENEDTEDFIRVKRTLQPKDLEETILELQKKSQTKNLSKVAVAKKILNKKLQVSEHIKFDSDDSSSSEGETNSEAPMLVDANSITPVPIDRYQLFESVDKIGGIEIDVAKKKLKASDKLDRKRERERIRALHQQKRKKGRLSETRTEVATLRESSEDEADSSSESEALPQAKRSKRVQGLGEDGQLGVEGDQAKLSDDEELALHLLKH